MKIVSNGTLNAGDVVTCTSDSNPEPTYTWTDSNGDVVFTGASITLSGNHDKLTCTATSMFTPECNALTTIYNVTGTWNVHTVLLSGLLIISKLWLGDSNCDVCLSAVCSVCK